MKLLLLSLLLLPVMAMSQNEYRVIDKAFVRGKTNMYLAVGVDSCDFIIVKIVFRGIGKKPDVIGRIGRYYPEGKGRRKVLFILNKKP